MFRGADCFLPTRKISTKLCSKGFWDTRIDSQVRLASRLNIKVPYHALQASGFTEKFYGHLLPRKLEGVPLVFRLCCQGKDSLVDKELEARRSKDSMIDKVIDLSMALDDEAARAWIDVNQTFSAIQEASAEESWVKEAVMSDAGDKTNKRNHREVLVREANELDEANHELEAITSRNSMISKGIDQLISLEEEAAHAWNDANQILHVVQEMIIEESVAKEPVQKAVIVLSPEKYKLIKEAKRLSETAKRAQNLVLEAEEEVMEMMIWGEQAMTLEREAIRRLSDAKTALKIAEKPHGRELDKESTIVDEDVASRLKESYQ
ncbi:hypothetical protein Rs2_02572 [Raphanus sativus]|nr:hypothetical protein Rs2_02572 [Raphanus sativus]